MLQTLPREMADTVRVGLGESMAAYRRSLDKAGAEVGKAAQALPDRSASCRTCIGG
jgi:hypothetical protein